ncbi:MAG: hypothetical protein AB7O56_09520 [Bauldia sp.]
MTAAITIGDDAGTLIIRPGAPGDDSFSFSLVLAGGILADYWPARIVVLPDGVGLLRSEPVTVLVADWSPDIASSTVTRADLALLAEGERVIAIGGDLLVDPSLVVDVGPSGRAGLKALLSIEPGN